MLKNFPQAIEKARQLVDNGDLSSAKALLQKLQEDKLYASNLSLLALQAEICGKSGQHEKAVKQYVQAIKKNKISTHLYWHLSILSSASRSCGWIDFEKPQRIFNNFLPATKKTMTP